MRGQVKWFNNSKGYGFIGRKDGPDVFVHYTAIIGEGYRTLTEGDVVEFEIVQGDVEVSDDFCKLLGYQREELIGKRYDDLSAPETNDIPTVFNLFCQLEYMHGLWMLVARGGTRILVRYDPWLRSDMLIEGHMQVVGAGD